MLQMAMSQAFADMWSRPLLETRVVGGKSIHGGEGKESQQLVITHIPDAHTHIGESRQCIRAKQGAQIDTILNTLK